MAPARLVFRKPAAEETPIVAVPPIDRTQRIEPERAARTVAALVERAALRTPLLEGRARRIGEQLRARDALAVGERIGVGAHEHDVRGSFHDPPGD